MNNLSQDSSITSTGETCTQSDASNTITRLFSNRLVESSVPMSLGGGGTTTRLTGFAAPFPIPPQTYLQQPYSAQCTDYSKLAKTFPWITEYTKLCRAEIGLTDMSILEKLMAIYIHHVSSSVTECYMKPNRAAKLKRTMYDTLMLFHFFYSDIKQPLEHSSYLDKMSYLMAMYIDMEIIASRRSKEYPLKIASKITSALFTFLDRSQDLILDAIFKTKYMNKNFYELCSLIFGRVLRDSPGRAVYELTYVRHVLAFKMWKRIVKGVDERRRIMSLAAMKLHPPSQFREKLRAGMLPGVLPKIPKQRKDITMFLMQAKFCIKERIEIFLKAVSDTKQQGMLSSHIATDLNSPLFFVHDLDTCRQSTMDEQEEHSGTTNLMNDIWTSMSIESGGVAHEIRIANMLKSKKMKKKCSKKLKGLKNKSESESKRQRPAKEPPPVEIKPDNHVETAIEVPFIKQEAKDENDVVLSSSTETSSLDPHQINKVDSNYSRCLEANTRDTVIPHPVKCESPASSITSVTCPPPVKCETPPVSIPPISVNGKPEVPDKTVTEDVWEPQEFSSDGFNKNTFLNALSLQPQESLMDEPEQNSISDQDCIKEMLKSIQEHGRNSKIIPAKPPKAVSPEPVKRPIELPVKKDFGLLHDQTLRRDFNIFISQQKFRSYYLLHSIPSGIPVPSPYMSDEGERCLCSQCCANRNALITNHKILTQYKESKLQGAAATEIGDQGNTSYLPLKKRKIPSVGKEKVCKGKLDDKPYPATPMISVAMLASNEKRKIYPEYTGPIVQAVNPLHQSAVACDWPAEAVSPQAAAPLPPQSPVPQTVPIPEPTVSPGPKFKTPAQLKEGWSQRPTPEITAAQSLIKFANSHNYHKSTDSPKTEVESSSKHKHKAKSEKGHSKRRKAT